MAKRKSISPAIEPPQISPAKGIELLGVQVGKGLTLLSSRPFNKDDYSSWKLLTKNYLEKAFGVNSPNVSSVIDVGKYRSIPINAGEKWWENQRAKSLKTQLNQIGGLVELLQTEMQLEQGTASAVARKPVKGHRIFLVHGHDEGVLHEIARFLEKLKRDVIVLREQPNQGKTIIEKFESYSDVGFAIVLLTADDRGGTRELPYEKQQLRARQNVIFELGYFIGRIGRNRVCALYNPGVEIPSNYSGVLYIQLDEQGGWRLSLAKEMKAAGLPIDMNLAL